MSSEDSGKLEIVYSVKLSDKTQGFIKQLDSKQKKMLAEKVRFAIAEYLHVCNFNPFDYL